MKLCPTCGQAVAEEIMTCPSCGSEIGEGRRSIDDYQIVEVLHEGYSSLLCHAVHETSHEHAMIRLFTPHSGVDEEVAARLEWELEKLKALPGEVFVRHHAIRRSVDGLWYRISEWVDTETWGSLLASGRLRDLALLLDLFQQMASALAVLHQHGHVIPHLILNDIMAEKGVEGKVKIKIDYKLSRFIDPSLDRPSPMLKKLLSSHPDIINQRPLDFKSDIWSLGKVFVEILSAEIETTDYLAKIEQLELAQDLKILLRLMLAEDPDFRPQSMTEIAESIRRIQESLSRPLPIPPLEAAAPSLRLLQRLQKRVWGLGALVLTLFLVGLFAWFKTADRGNDLRETLETYANRYARSVAFLMVEYWLEVNGERVYRNVAEGTAFLVDREGYLLTSRHVACPWLEDPQFAGVAQQLRMQNLTPVFGCRLFLWFEGQRAFNRAGRMIESPDLTDFFFVENAFSTEAPPRLHIAGVAKSTAHTRQMFTSPLKDDFAVLKIEKVPAGLEPIPVDLGMDPRKLPKLTRVIALGFPLGARTQTDTVNVSVVEGNVRRTFENMFQIDASLHGGNSGGPVIDARGKAIGIVSAVAVDLTQGLVPMITPVWDIGLILPMTEAVRLLADLKAGRAKWNGMLDFSQEAALQKMRDAASQGRWADAMQLADMSLAKSPQPDLLTAAGVLHFCNGDFKGAKQRFLESLSMDPEDNQTRLMLMLIDRLMGLREETSYRRELLEADWRSTAEFQGYLARVLEGSLSLESALKGWYTPGEKSWLCYIGGWIRSQKGQTGEAENLFEEAILSADPDSWEFLLSLAAHQELKKERRKLLRTDQEWADYITQAARSEKTKQESMASKEKRRAALAALWSSVAAAPIALEEKRDLLEKTLELDPENRIVAASLAYSAAALGDWPDAMRNLRKVLATESRQNAVRMSLGLLEAGILHVQGNEAEARANLSDYTLRTRDSWFLAIAEHLLGRQAEEEIRKEAGEVPEKVITAFTVMGFWAEGSRDKAKALRFYQEALGSFLDDWFEYDFARERIKQLRQSR
ncbi:MAG: trypsin-like peptidase domain-containing protein [Desulfobacterota bacterium]|nr:trypsin-like peptidase domain-containing protein [Thermodesulfobacteriota bacterium]